MFDRNTFGKISKTSSNALLSFALVVVTLAIYMQVKNHQFLNFDDDVYVTENPHVASGITGQNIKWAFSSVEAGNWHPVTWLSHMADVQIDPDYKEAHLNLGQVFQIKGYLDEAIKEYQEALRVDPAYVNAQTKLAQALAQKKMQDETRK